MDPDAALERLRELASEITGRTDGESYDYMEITADLGNELAETFENLDEWIKKGGFLPKEWKSERKLTTRTRP
jgi:hypothetical protein